MENLEFLNTPIPEATDSYVPVPHKDVIDHAKDRIESKGLQIIGEKYKPAAKGKELVGTFTIASQSQIFSYQLGFKNSYDKTLSLGYGSGVEVRVCGNGQIMTVNGVMKQHKHTTNIERMMNKMLDEVIQNMEHNFNEFEERMNRFVQVQLSNKLVSQIVGDLFLNRDLITTPQLNIIKNEIQQPSFDYGTEGNSLFDLYNHTTHSYKENHPYYDFRKQLDLYNAFDEYYTELVDGDVSTPLTLPQWTQ